MKANPLTFFLLIISVCFSVFTRCQTTYIFSGKVVGVDGHEIPHASVLLKDINAETVLAYAITKPGGRFTISKTDLSDGEYLLVVEYINTPALTRKVSVSKTDPVKSGILFQLEPSGKQLKDIVIKAVPLPFSIRGDTIEFTAKSYKTSEMKKVEDLLRNIQGFDLGSDGKISFNGKEVDRILIEGEDLTEKNYQLLSRNLNANLVDKIQVINNFSTDRLLKEVETSGKVGINLTVDATFQNKLSGSIEAGSGVGGREYLDNNLVLLTRKTKMLSFLNYNETGFSANANLQYYYNPNDQSAEASSNDQGTKGFLNTGTIYLPQLGQTYTRKNEDMAAFIINAWKAGEGVRMKALAGAGWYRLQNKAAGINQFLPADGNGWFISQFEKSASSLSEAIIKFSVTHDHKKNNTGFIHADISGNHSTFNYANLSYGDIRDTLTEKLSGKGLFYAISGSETFRLNNGLILKANIRLDRENITQDFGARTNRYQDYFLLDSNFIFYRQQLDGILINQELDLAVFGKRKLTNWHSGFRVFRQKTSYDAISNSTDQGRNTTIQLNREPSGFHVLQATAYGMFNRMVHKKGELSLGINAGAGIVELNQQYSFIQKSAPLFRTVLGYRLVLSPIKSISVQYNYSSQLPEKDFFHPKLLLSGLATILNPAEQLSIRRIHQFNFSYVSQKLHKGSGFMFFTSYSRMDGSYIYSNERTASYGLLFFLPQNGSRFLSAQLKMEKYVSRVKTKFTLVLSSVYKVNSLTYNEAPSRNKMHNISIQPKAATALKGPVNMEASFTGMYTRNMTVPESGLASDFELWQYQGYGKLKIKAGKKIYLAAMYNFYNLAPKNFFHTMDLFANYALNRAWMFSFTLHNLFNSSSIIQRQFGVNSIAEQRFDLVERYFLFKLNWSF